MKTPPSSFLPLVHVIALGSAVAVAGCTSSSASHERAHAHGQTIVDGTRDLKDTSVVLVIIQHETDPTDETSFTCSGALVAPHVVLTAAHCLDEKIVGKGQSFYAFFGDDIDDEVQVTNKKNFGYTKTIAMHPDFDASRATGEKVPPADIGVMILHDKAPVAPLQLQREKLAADIVGKSLHVVGYGQTTPGKVATAGRRMDNTASIVGLEDLFLVSESTDHSMCEGDSGGPSFFNDRIVGVHSWVEHKTSCTGKNYDMRVDAYASWIDAQIQAADPGFVFESPADAGGGDDASGMPPGATPPPSGGSGSGSGGCTMGTATTGAGWHLAMLLALVALRRRRGR